MTFTRIYSVGARGKLASNLIMWFHPDGCRARIRVYVFWFLFQGSFPRGLQESAELGRNTAAVLQSLSFHCLMSDETDVRRVQFVYDQLWEAQEGQREHFQERGRVSIGAELKHRRSAV